MDPDDWTMGSLAAQDGYEAMPVSSNVIDRRSFVPVPFEQPSDEERFQYELLRDMKMNRDLKMDRNESGSPADPIPQLEPMPGSTGDDELDEARGGLRPLTREELDQFQAQMMMDKPTAREEAMMMGNPYDPWGLREGAEKKLSAMSLEQIGLAAPQGGIGSILRPSTPQGNFDAYLDQRRGYEPQGMIDRIQPAYPHEVFDVRRRR